MADSALHSLLGLTTQLDGDPAKATLEADICCTFNRIPRPWLVVLLPLRGCKFQPQYPVVGATVAPSIESRKPGKQMHI